jgi:hypothetical protein
LTIDLTAIDYRGKLNFDNYSNTIPPTTTLFQIQADIVHSTSDELYFPHANTININAINLYTFHLLQVESKYTDLIVNPNENHLCLFRYRANYEKKPEKQSPKKTNSSPEKTILNQIASFLFSTKIISFTTTFFFYR